MSRKSPDRTGDDLSGPGLSFNRLDENGEIIRTDVIKPEMQQCITDLIKMVRKQEECEATQDWRGLIEVANWYEDRKAYWMADKIHRLALRIAPNGTQTELVLFSIRVQARPHVSTPEERKSAARRKARERQRINDGIKRDEKKRAKASCRTVYNVR